MNKKFTLHISDEFKFSKMQTMILEEELEKLPSLKEDSVNVKPIYIYEEQDCYETCVMIRSTVKAPINFNTIPIALKMNGEIISTLNTDLSKIGLIEPNTAVPVLLKFPLNPDVSSINFKKSEVVFLNNINAKQTSKLEIKYIDTTFNDYEKKVIEQYVSNVPPMEKNTLTIKCGELLLRDDKGILPLYLFNTTEKEHVIKNLNIMMVPKALGAARLNKLIIELPKAEINGVTVLAIVILPTDTPASLQELAICDVNIKLN